MMRIALIKFRRPVDDVWLVSSIQTSSEAAAESIVKAFHAVSRHPAMIVIPRSERWQVTLRRREWIPIPVFFAPRPLRGSLGENSDP